MTRPSVAIVTTYYHPVLGGAEAAAQRLAGFLHRRGHAVRVLTKRTSRQHARRDTVDGVEVERLPPAGERSSLGKWAFLPALFAALVRRRGRADVVCCVDYRAVGLAALAARGVTGTPVIFQAQTDGVLSGARVRSWLRRIGIGPDGALADACTWPIRALYRRADALGCISRGLEREALAAGMRRDRVHYLPNPVSLAAFSPLPPPERAALRARLGVEAGATVAVFVGRLSREKGAMELVRAWADARPRGQLVLVGPPMTNHPWDVGAEAEAFVRSHDLGGRVRFTGGQPADMVAAWLRVSDFAVQPSHFEAMGLAAAEAMAAGLPVIASDVGGFRDFVVDGQTGLLVPVGDVAALAKAIARLSEDAALRTRLGAAALTAARAFDENVVLERFAGLIDRLAGAR